MIDTSKSISAVSVDGTQMTLEGGSATLGTKSITQNGTYNASSDGYDGYSSVTVNVSGGSGGGSNGMQTFIDLRNSTLDDNGGVMGCRNLFNNMADMTNAQLATIMSGVDTSSVEYWGSCFRGCNITALPNLDFSGAIDCAAMCEKCGELQTVTFDMPSVVEGYGMFLDCMNLESVTITNSTNLENVVEMFSGCENLQSVIIDATSVTDTADMFLGSVVPFDTLILSGLRVDLDISDITASSSCLAGLLNSLGDVANDGNPNTGGYTATLTMGATNLAKLSQQDIDNAAAKGWTLT